MSYLHNGFVIQIYNNWAPLKQNAFIQILEENEWFISAKSLPSNPFKLGKATYFSNITGPKVNESKLTNF